MIWKSPISSCDLVPDASSLCEQALWIKPAAVNPEFVGLVIGVVRTDLCWQQFHEVNSALYLLATGFWMLGFSWQTFGSPAKSRHFCPHVHLMPFLIRLLFRCHVSAAWCHDVDPIE